MEGCFFHGNKEAPITEGIKVVDNESPSINLDLKRWANKAYFLEINPI